RFGAETTRIQVERAGKALGLEGPLSWRQDKNGRFVADEGHFILDASFGRIPDANALSTALLQIPGVVQHGLFLDMADLAIVSGPGGLRELRV
ncbi:MAG: ribose-5-phosphate isomerase A, partial [Nitratireductor sp.]|nr:ribose-5-phosphate isomerase A [Nitratireductor sp.]